MIKYSSGDISNFLYFCLRFITINFSVNQITKWVGNYNHTCACIMSTNSYRTQVIFIDAWGKRSPHMYIEHN